MDAITLLKNDHKTVNALFRRFEKAGDRAVVEKREVVDRIIEELSTHAAIEEQLFYPVARATVPDTADLALESLEEHHIVKLVLSELERMDPTDERFDAKVTVLIENVRHHVKEEEEDFFPKVRDELGRSALGDLGDAMVEAKKTAPTHPHPGSPDTPPGNVAAGNAAGVADRLGDTVSGVAQGGLMAIQDLIATVLQRKQPRMSPRGTSVARDAAGKVRKQAATVTAEAIETIQEAKRTGEKTLKRTSKKSAGTAKAAKRGATRTAKAAKAGAKGTATSARKAAGNTKSTAKRGATTTGRTAKTSAKQTRIAAKRS